MLQNCITFAGNSSSFNIHVVWESVIQIRTIAIERRSKSCGISVRINDTLGSDTIIMSRRCRFNYGFVLRPKRIVYRSIPSRKHLRTKVTPDLHLTYIKKRGKSMVGIKR